MMSWFDVQTTQMPIFILFVSAAVLFEGDKWRKFHMKTPVLEFFFHKVVDLQLH